MANLVTITREGRIILKFGGIILGVLILLYFGVKGGSLIRDIFFPKPPPPPKQAFGKLPHLQFPSVGTAGIQFIVNTTTGSLPMLPDRSNVYKLKTSSADLLALKNARNAVDSEYIVENETKLTDTLYQWSQTNTGVIMQYDIASKNFTISSNYLTNPFLISTNLLPQNSRIEDDMMSFLSLIGADTSDIDTDKTTVDLFQIQNGSLVPAENTATAKFAKVTLFQKDIDQTPIIYDTPTDSSMNFIVSYPANSNLVPVQGEFFHHLPNLDEKSDYPIKTAAQALEDLKKGNAYMINPQNLTTVDITDVNLAYFLDKNTKEYMMPVIVFTGINFTAYVEAIPDSSLN
jgi:hypothetical protein